MAVKWTQEQLDAINAKSEDGSILVSAAAGSGKTAVLVERVIEKILKEGASIDRMLVVTFTDAAASEMRDKIIRRMYAELAKAVREERDTKFLKEQLRLSADADIMTIDSFCIRVLRNNFYALGVDPDFRIADSAEAELLEDDALNALFDRLYKADESAAEGVKFNHLLRVYATNRSDDKLKKLVKYIHRFIQSFAEPIKWLDEKAGMYAEDMSESEWVTRYVPELFIRNIGRSYREAFMKLLETAGAGPEEDGSLSEAERAALAERYGEMANGLCGLFDAADALARADSLREANEIFAACVSGMDRLTLKNKPKDISVDMDDWRAVCKARNDLKNKFFGDCAVFGAESVDAQLHGSSLKTLADEIVWLVKEFDAEFTRRKDLRNAREFGDIEHLVYRLFSENEAARRECRDRYDEIFIDEYQDTNGLQDSIFSLISRDGKNLFMVGDLKQSIYRFRGGDPTIFKSRSKSYELAETPGLRVSLSQNFRSRQEILRSVNDVFEGIMSEELGDVNYSGRERISRLSDADDKNDECRSEAHFVAYDGAGDEEMTSTAAEAEFAAERISQLIGGGFTITEKGKERPLKSRDICILCRSVRGGIGAVFSDALARRGINAHVEIEDYFEKREVQLMLSLISVIDNNLQDIPLIAVMRSPIGGFSDNDLARIRIYTPSGPMFTALRGYRENEDGITNEEIALKIKCRRLAENLKRWRGYVKRKSVAELIWSIYEETGLYDFMGALEGGEESQANLRLFYERAKQYEQSGFKGLFNFIKYMEKLRDRQGDLSSAELIGESHDVVRIMTIHKSKGLEFPVVILTGAMKKFVTSGGNANVALHKDLGFGLRYADTETGYFEETLFSKIVKEQNARESLSESMRLLYVAMTRPQHKLIVIASKKLTETEERTRLELADDEVTRWKAGADPAAAKSYADWIFPEALKHPDDWEFEVHDLKLPDGDEEAAEKPVKREVSDELREVIRRSLEYEYKFPESGYIPAKTSVTALKQRGGEDDYDTENTDRKYEYDPIYMEDMPAFMRDKKRGTEIGTAHHQLMAYIDLNAAAALSPEEYESFAEDEIRRLADEGQLDDFYCRDDNMRRTIARHAAGFFKSALGARVLAARDVYREQPFQIEIGANVYDPSLGDKYGGEKVILQGIIDCFFERGDGKIVLLDYKTDRCSDDDGARAIAEKYAVQLRLYTEAIERITGKEVAEKYLYLFAMGKEISVD